MDKKIYNLIKERIINGHYKPSQLINEKQLINELAVSRTPIRESLAKLEWEKLVNIVPRAGAIVSPIELGLIREVYQVRILIEGYLGKLAADKITDTQIEKISKILDTALKLKKNGGTKDDVINLDIEFRNIMADAAGNKTLKEISDYLFNITIRVWYSAIGNNISEEVEIETKHIKDTISALKDRDNDKVEQIRRSMISGYVEKLKKTFDF